MRRVLAVLVLTLGMVVSAALTAPDRPTAQAAEITPIAARPADSLVDAYGVGIHLAFLDTPYADAGKVADALADLGVRHVRDDLFMRNPRQYAGIGQVADRGIGFDLIMGRPTSELSAAEYVRTVAEELPPGSVESLEGSNEWDLFGGGDDWPAELLTRQRELYQAAKANPKTRDLPVLAPALAFKWNYAALGDVSPYADKANAHMYPGGYKPSNEISQITSALRQSVPDKPLVVTEAGYHNATSTSNGHLPVPEDVAGVYQPRLLLEHVLRGNERVYSYELVDEFADPQKTDPEANFGLLRRDWTPKPAYTAMKSLLALLADPGPAFQTQPLPFRITGAGADGRYLLTQKRTGQYVLLLWRDVAVWDPVLRQRTPVAPDEMTLQLGSTYDITVYKPTQGPVAQQRARASQLPLSLDGEVTAITLDVPKAAQKATSKKATRSAYSWLRLR